MFDQVTTSDWFAAAMIGAGTLLLAWSVRRLTKRRIRKVDTHAELIDLAGRIVSVFILATGGYYTLQALNLSLGPLLGTLGISVLFIAVGLQPLLVNIVGSAILQTRRPFRRGDQILTNGYEGTVIDITSNTTVLLSYNGEAIHVPNGLILSNPLVNWTHEPVRRSVMPITVPYGCHLPKVLRTIGKAARDILADENLPPAEALAVGFGEHGIETELRYWHYSDELESRVAQSQVTVAVDRALADIDVVIPYPQMVVHRSEADVAREFHGSESASAEAASDDEPSSGGETSSRGAE